MERRGRMKQLALFGEVGKIDKKIGKRFGRLVVAKRVGSRKGHARYQCQCDCGNIAIVRSDNFKSTKNRRGTKSCGCLGIETKKENGEDRSYDLTGVRFGYLTAVCEDGKNPKGEKFWKCKCVCGKYVVVNGKLLRKNPDRNRHCGCKNKKQEIPKQRSKKFPRESKFQKHCISVFKEMGVECCGNDSKTTGYEIDIRTERVCYELKTGNDPYSMYCAIGQSLVNSCLSGLVPGIIIPSDVTIPSKIKKAMEYYNIKTLNETNLE
jgi:hypothetical protein